MLCVLICTSGHFPTPNQLTFLQVLTPLLTPLPMVSSVDLGTSSGGSFRRLRLASACKKLSHTLDLLKLTPLTDADPDPSGPIATRDFLVDYRQLPPCQTTASDFQHINSSPTFSKSKCHPCPDIDEDSDDSRTYSSRLPTNSAGPPASLS